MLSPITWSVADLNAAVGATPLDPVFAVQDNRERHLAYSAALAWIEHTVRLKGSIDNAGLAEAAAMALRFAAGEHGVDIAREARHEAMRRAVEPC